MASSLVTVQDGSATAVAVAGASQPAGLNVTAGNVVTIALTDIVGVTGWLLKSVANNQNINDQTFSTSTLSINQTTGVATFTAGAEGGWFVFYSEVIMYTSTPTVQKATFGVYISAAGSAKCNFVTLPQLTGGTQQANLVAAMQAAASLPSAAAHGQTLRQARNCVVSNVASLAAFTITAAALNDNVSGGNVAGDYVLLVAQTTPAQNGLYKVGTVVSTTAPLTRAEDWITGQVFEGREVKITAGTLFARSTWAVDTVGAIVVDTTSVTLFPDKVTQSVVLVAGTATITNVPIRSTTTTQVLMQRTTANTSTATTGGYCPTTAGANSLTAGALGTGQVVIQATIAAGTINNADISTLAVTIQNW